MKVNDSTIHISARKKMVQQLKEMGITSQKVLNSMGKIPRHFFFHKDFSHHAYQNKAFPIAMHQTISQPYTVAIQTQLLGLQPNDKVLEVGTGSGYQAAILAGLCAHVYSIERHQILLDKASDILRFLTLKVSLFLGDGSKGLPEHAPFNKIIVTAAAPKVPDLLIKQLKNGGTLVVPIGDKDVQKMVVIKKNTAGKIHVEEHGHFSFVPLIGAEGW